MQWDQRVVDLANTVEAHIQGGQTAEALEALRELREITHIDPPPPSLLPKPPAGPYFGDGPLPDEDW